MPRREAKEPIAWQSVVSRGGTGGDIVVVLASTHSHQFRSSTGSGYPRRQAVDLWGGSQSIPWPFTSGRLPIERIATRNSTSVNDVDAQRCTKSLLLCKGHPGELLPAVELPEVHILVKEVDP
ncbi:hypothetical protein MAR_003666 [Mya arenaria]|uniref:Uncharacterized protein n=1 Tax=Mya arenaria TaxID=6604 RepID=A0ABY7GA58_MYAAR|nr:hypothetical protein MAR_003666 [Mya arenaria]